MGDFRKGPVAAAQVQCVARDFGLVCRFADGKILFRLGGIGALILPDTLLTAEHFDHQEIVNAIAVDVGRVHGHGRHRHFTPGERRDCAKSSLTIIQPKPVSRTKVIVADINIRRPIAVEIAEHHGQSPLLWRGTEGFARFIQKRAVGPGDGCKPPVALVAVENVGFPFLDHLDLAVAVKEPDETLFRRDADFALDNPRGDFGRGAIVARGGNPIIGHVEIEVSVAIHVRQRQ